MPFEIGGMEFDRCPLAHAREASDEVRAWVDAGIRWGLAKRQGSLSTFIEHPSARTIDIIDRAEDQILKVQAEYRKEAERKARGK